MFSTIRRRIGTAKSTITSLISDIKPQLEDGIAHSLTLEQYTNMKTSHIKIQCKLERHINVLEKLDEKFLAILTPLAEKDPEHSCYVRCAEGDNGYLTVIRGANKTTLWMK